jgi:hypothetical protein
MYASAQPSLPAAPLGCHRRYQDSLGHADRMGPKMLRQMQIYFAAYRRGAAGTKGDEKTYLRSMSRR